uniref:Uncharacterized protein n=1 Tax=Rhizophora mucronata TaxID=61149 RepID=A0A2P2R2T8_RHIMU
MFENRKNQKEAARSSKP